MTKPKVTVVTITWNNLEGLKTTVASLARQAEKDVQHIIVDGASKDGSAEWARRNQAFRDTTVISEPDRGIYDAMNKGLALASAPLVAFLNAGDAYARPDVLSRAVASFEAEGWVWGFGLARTVDEGGRGLKPVRYRPYSNKAHGWGRIFVSHQCVFMKTDWLQGLGGFDERFGPAADVHALLTTGLRHAPKTWPTVDVHYLSGGVSDRQVSRQLWRKHLIRSKVWRLGPGRRALSAAWAYYQIASLPFRRFAKRLLGPRFRQWWGRRRTGGAIE